MKRSFLSRSKPRAKKRPVLVATLGVALVLVLIEFAWPSALPVAAYDILSPLLRARIVVSDSLGIAVAYFHTKADLENENLRLSDALSLANEKLIGMQALEGALATLEASSTLAALHADIRAAVLLNPPLSPYDTLVLDQGSSSGVAVGDTVRSLGGTAIGTVTDVTPRFSRATLLSSPGSEVPVVIGASGIQATASGVGNGEFQMLLPRETDIRVGDAVTFSGFSPVAVGSIDSVEHESVDYLELVSFRSPVNINQIRYVLISPSDVSAAKAALLQ